MAKVDIGDLSRLAFPKGVRQQYSALAWESQRQYFLILLVFGALLFLIGGLL